MLKRRCGFNVLASGDDVQCDPPLDKYQVYVDLFNNKYFRQITGNKNINIQYNPEFARYPKSLLNVISEFRQTLVFPKFPIAHELTKMHLTCANTRARELCVQCNKEFSENTLNIKHHNFHYYVGMPLVGVQYNGYLKCARFQNETNEKNAENYQVHNKEEYEIVTLDVVYNTFRLLNKRTKAMLENVEINSVYNMMMPFFAMTIDASQSSQIDMPFTIHELDNPRFNVVLATFAMSRSTELEYIHRATDYHPTHILEHTKRTTQVIIFPQSDNTNNSYKKTIVYEIWVNGQLAYVGHTYLTVKERLQRHFQDSNITVVKAFACELL